MKISVAVPSYNYGIYLSSCLASIASQEYDNYEVLIADGGSTDNSLNIISEYCRLDERFKLISTEDAGQSDAVTKAFSVSRGDILCFLNADDVFLSTRVFSDVVSSFTDYTTADIISFGGCYVDKNGRIIKNIRLRYHPLDNYSQMKYRTAVIQPSTFWRRFVYFETPFKRNFEYSFDSVFFYECFLKYNWVEFDTPISGYRWHESNKSGELSSNRLTDIINFEKLKFGKNSPRVIVLYFVYIVFKLIDKIQFYPIFFKKNIRRIVNSLSFLSFYRLPSF